MQRIKIVKHLHHGLYIFLLEKRYQIETQFRLVLGAFNFVCGWVYWLLRVLMPKMFIPGVAKVLVPGLLIPRVAVLEMLVRLSI